jgi:hypothetical protein
MPDSGRDLLPAPHRAQAEGAQMRTWIRKRRMNSSASSVISLYSSSRSNSTTYQPSPYRPMRDHSRGSMTMASSATILWNQCRSVRTSSAGTSIAPVALAPATLAPKRLRNVRRGFAGSRSSSPRRGYVASPEVAPPPRGAVPITPEGSHRVTAESGGLADLGEATAAPPTVRLNPAHQFAHRPKRRISR